MIIGFNIFPGSIVVVTDGQTYNLTADSHRFYDKIRSALRDGESDTAESLLNVTEHVQEFVDNRLTVVDGLLQFEGRGVGTKMSEYMFRMMDEGFSVDPLVKFLTNLHLNPSLRAVTELYSFLDANTLPLTEDGHFLAYKFVNDNYMDCHTGTFDNSIGSVCEMPRNEVNDDKDQTCSDGLHFCSEAYLKGGWGTRWMIVKINPRDVVSIPVDYQNTKGRTCRYEVIAEIERPEEDRQDFDGAFDGVVDETFDTARVGDVTTDGDDPTILGYSTVLGTAHGSADYSRRMSQKKGVDYAFNPRIPAHYSDIERDEYLTTYRDALANG